MQHTNFLTFRDFSVKHPSFPETTLRWIRFCSTPGRRDSRGVLIPANKMGPAFIKLGSRVYVDEFAFFELLAKHHREAEMPREVAA